MDLQPDEVMPLLLELKQQMAVLTGQADKSDKTDSVMGENSSLADQHDMLDQEYVDEPDPLPTDITPTTLRRRTPVMSQAVERLERIRWQDDEIEASADIGRARLGGKKSGSLLVASEAVEERIDWPHMYVSRTSTGRRKGIAYHELTVAEFAFGFISMIESPRCVWDYKTMVRLLRLVMQHEVDYSWETARAWYEEMGVEVEQGLMEWTNGDRIQELRFRHAKHKQPERKEPQENSRAQENSRPQPKVAPAGMKACAAFQTRTCEQSRDHPPFTHTCAYCLRICNLVCRHTETECIRRVTDAAKNGKKREPQGPL